MNYFEIKLFEALKLSFRVQYVGFYFGLINCYQFDINHAPSVLNFIDACNHFTFETENENCIPFLDVLIGRNKENFNTTLYRKHFDVTCPQDRLSFQPSCQKIAPFKTFAYRSVSFFVF